MTRSDRARVVVGVLVGIGAIALVSGFVALLERGGVPVLSLGALYVFAVLPAAVLWGAWLAVPVGLLSMVVFNFFFLPPTGTLHLRNDENWVVLALYLVVAVVVSELAARARRQAASARRREQEAVLLSAIATSLLADASLYDGLESTAGHLASVLGVSEAAIVLATAGDASESATTLPLVSGDVQVGVLVVEGPIRAPAEVVERFLPAVAALLLLAVERERLESEAVEAEKLRASDAIKTTILRSVSHDLRSPLTAIRVAADGLANHELSLSSADREALARTVREEAERLDLLVGDLLDLSRLEAGAVRPEVALWPVDELVWRGLEAAGLDDERIEVDVPADLPVAVVDGTQIVHAVANVLRNARAHARSRVVVGAARDGDAVVLRVSNDGLPVPEADRERIFQPFQHGSGPTAGTGLGLAIARGFVSANGGTVVLEPGTTATFAIRLPARELETPVAS